MIDDTPKDQETDDTPEDQEKDSSLSKIDLLKSILLEVNIFATTVKNLESSLYQKEQETEAAAAEAYLEQEPKDEEQAVPVDEEDEPKIESDEDEESTFFSIIKNALGFMIILLPLLFKGFEDIKKMFGELPDIMKGSFKDIVFALFGKIQGAIEKYVFEPISDYLSNTVSEIWKSLISSIEDTFSGIIGGLPEFLKESLPDIVKKNISGSVKDFGEGKPASGQPEFDTEGSFGATEAPSFGGKYDPPKFGSQAGAAPPTSAGAAPPTSAGAPTATGMPPSTAAPPPPPAAAPPAAAPPATTSVAPPASDAVREEPSSQERSTTPNAVSAAMPKVSQDVAENFGLIETALKNLGIDDPKYVRAVKANVMKESQGKAIEEVLQYGGTSNKRIREVFGDRARRFTDEQLNEIKKDPVKMGEMMYGAETKLGQGMGNTEPGDGYKFRGRGFIQLTGKSNYANASKDLFKDDRLVQNPDLLLDPTIAALATAWYMKKGKSSMAKRLGIDENNMTQEEANLLATSQIAGSDVSKWKGSYGKELLSKVSSYADKLGPSDYSSSTQLASTDITSIPATQGEQIAATTQEVKQATEAAEEKEQQQVIIQAAAATQVNVNKGPKTEAPVNPKPRIASVQQSYSNYFAIA